MPENQDPNAEPESQGMKELREANERNKAEADAGRAAQRELAFMKAGVDTGTKVGELFTKAYDGEMEPEAIAASWSEVAPPKEPASEPGLEGEPTETTPPADPAAAAETQMRQQVAAGNAPPPLKEPDFSIEDAYAEYRKRIANGEQTKEASIAVIGNIIGSAVNGDENFLVQPK